jgi:enoyl-CoA hydratase/carnithine racemase
MPYREVIYEVADRVATVTLNRPDKLNALTARMGMELQGAMLEADADENVRAIILTGAGRGFCAGADMDLLTSIQGGARASGDDSIPVLRESVAQPRETAREDFRKQYSYFPSILKPIIAAINGPVAGLGFVLTLYCDIRIASETARFGSVFARRGLIAEHGVSWLLPRLVGIANACDLLFSGRMIDAQEALRMGLVSRLEGPDDLIARARDIVMEMVTLASPRSIRVMKEQLYNAQLETLAEAIDAADDEMIKSFDSEDFREGVAHFVEKRRPRFSGK